MVNVLRSVHQEHTSKTQNNAPHVSHPANNANQSVNVQHALIICYFIILNVLINAQMVTINQLKITSVKHVNSIVSHVRVFMTNVHLVLMDMFW